MFAASSFFRCPQIWHRSTRGRYFRIQEWMPKYFTASPFHMWLLGPRFREPMYRFRQRMLHSLVHPPLLTRIGRNHLPQKMHFLRRGFTLKPLMSAVSSLPVARQAAQRVSASLVGQGETFST